MFYTIYKITNKVNNKYYIGKHQTKNLDDGYMGSGKLIKRAITKYGIENFTKEILYVFETEEEMNTKEKELVIISEETYNLCEGGKGGFGYINANNLAFGGNPKEASIKGSKIGVFIFLDKYHNDPSFKKKILDGSFLGTKRFKQKYPNGTNGFLGKKHTNQTKQKISQSATGKHKGTKNSQYGTCWITNGIENKKIQKEELDIWLERGYYKGRIGR